MLRVVPTEHLVPPDEARDVGRLQSDQFAPARRALRCCCLKCPGASSRISSGAAKIASAWSRRPTASFPACVRQARSGSSSVAVVCMASLYRVRTDDALLCIICLLTSDKCVRATNCPDAALRRLSNVEQEKRIEAAAPLQCVAQIHAPASGSVPRGPGGSEPTAVLSDRQLSISTSEEE